MTEAMSCFQIIHVVRNPNTGVAASIAALAQAQLSAGLDAKLVILKSNSWKPTQTIRSLPQSQYWSPRLFGTAAIQFHSWFRRYEAWTKYLHHLRRPAVVHYHDAWLSGALLLPHAPLGMAQVVTYHGLAAEAQLRRQPIRRALHRHWARKVETDAHAVVTVDARTPHRAAILFGVDAARFIHIPNGSPRPLIPDTSIVRRNGGQLVVGHVGIVDDGKGWRITAEAVDRARATGVDASLLIAGDGPESSQARAWCEERGHYCQYLGWVDNIPEKCSPISTFYRCHHVQRGCRWLHWRRFPVASLSYAQMWVA